MSLIRGLARIWFEPEGWIVEVELLELMVSGSTAGQAVAEMLLLMRNVVEDDELRAGSPLVTALYTMNEEELIEALFGRHFEVSKNPPEYITENMEYSTPKLEEIFNGDDLNWEASE